MRLSGWSGGIPEIESHIRIDAYSDGEFQRAITIGMKKFGLPDVVVDGFPVSDTKNVGNLINSFSQLMAESDRFRLHGNYKLELSAIKNTSFRESQVKGLGANAFGEACVTLSDGTREEGDPHNRLVRLGADTYPGLEPHLQQGTLLSLLFGSEDSITHINHTDELLAASAKAKAKLPELQKAFNDGLQPGEYIEVKAPFVTRSGGQEWMWVEVSSWKGDQIRGLLDNDPVEVEHLHTGQMVSVRQGDVFDYLRHYADKRVEGNTTGDVIKKMSESKSEKAPRPLPIETGCGRLP
jgi:uncharacterized protein YegJ (DUF2314 family)